MEGQEVGRTNWRWHEQARKLFFSQIFFFFRLCYAARGILIPPPGIELRPPALEAQSLNHWTTRKVPQMLSSILLSSCDIVMYNKYILVFVPTSGIQTKEVRSGGSDGKESACKAGDLGSTSGLGRFPGEANGYPFLYSCLGNPMDRGVWQATVHGLTKGLMTKTTANSVCVIMLTYFSVQFCSLQ